MKKEIVTLEEEGNKLEKQAEDLATMIDDLEKRTMQLKEEYENLIKEKQ
jgi:FtsZ-binding cell division protein ZapB